MAKVPFSEIKPPQIDDGDWICFLKSMFLHVDSDIEVINKFYVDMVESDILDAIRESFIEVEEQKRIGRWVTTRGLRPSQKKWDIPLSIRRYGRLLPGTDMGFHREFQAKPGKKKGEAGSFVVIWDLGRVNTHGEETCKIFNEEITLPARNFYNSLAAVYLLINEAERRGDFFTLISGPGRDIRVLLDVPPNKDQKLYEWKLATGGVRKFRFFQDLLNHSLGYYDTPLTEERKRYMEKSEKTSSISKGVSELSEHLLHINSKSYQTVRKQILQMRKPLQLGVVFSAKPASTYLTGLWPSLVKTARSTVVIIGAMEYPSVYWLSWRDFRSWYDNADVYMIDVGERDNTALFEDQEFFVDPIDRKAIRAVYLSNKNIDVKFIKNKLENRLPSSISTGVEYINTHDYGFKIKHHEFKVLPWYHNSIRVNIDFDTDKDHFPTDSKFPGHVLESNFLSVIKESGLYGVLASSYSVYKPRGPRTVNYVYVGDDINNLSMRVLAAVGAELGGVPVSAALGEQP